MTRILILARGVVGKYMSSPGIRAYYMAQVLAKELPDAQITLAVTNKEDQPKIAGVKVVRYGAFRVLRLIAQNDIIISSAFMPHFAFFFREKQFVADLFSQYFIEWMELTRAESRGLKQAVWMNTNRTYLNMQLTIADYIICANERQRDTYVGSLSALGLIDPDAYEEDDTLRRYIDVVPHGIRPDEIKHKRQVLKGVYAGINEGDKVLLWNGGTVAWYDPEPFLRALHILSKERDDIKAVFLGTFYPDLSAFLGYGQRFQTAFQLAKDLGLYQKSVFFEFGWVPHAEVTDYLIESDLGVCTYFDNLETRYSHRTRFVDIFWAEKPLICTRGDVLAEMVEERGLGIVVEEGDTEGVANAIRRLVDDEAFYKQCQENLHTIKPELTWDVALKPLVRFCRDQDSSAVAKSGRMLPLLRRILEYLMARFQDRITPNPR
ncbi:MAG: glycosyltransferase [Chloroflexi bacterium]|nr:glycosyltransferase [Chloroflexota bacterium]